MKSFPFIRVWEGCDLNIAKAVRQFQDRWSPYSAASRGKRVDRLIKELIDPAVASYATSSPQRYLSYIPGAGGVVPLSEIVGLVGLNSTARLQRQLLRAFVSAQAEKSERDQQFVATLETLLDLIRSCARKPPFKSKIRDTRLNGRRAQEFCRLCGAPAELTDFILGNDNAKRDDPEDKLRLSSLYCTDHRPQLPNGEWNLAYRKAKRSIMHFDKELARLTKQSGNLDKVKVQSGDPLVDLYIYHYVHKYGLTPGDEAELRNHARRMADGKLSDRKKQMVMLLHYRISQADAARRLGIERQAVFKALTALPSEFHQLPNLSGFSVYFLTSTENTH